jgi:hypothetical protein
MQNIGLGYLEMQYTLEKTSQRSYNALTCYVFLQNIYQFFHMQEDGIKFDFKLNVLSFFNCLAKLWGTYYIQTNQLF